MWEAFVALRSKWRCNAREVLLRAKLDVASMDDVVEVFIQTSSTYRLSCHKGVKLMKDPIEDTGPAK